MITKGCPRCGKHSFTFKFRFCPWCNVKLVENEKQYFEEINHEYTERIFGLNYNKNEEKT